MLTRQKTYFTSKAKLFLVGTPIGNYEDITFRAINVLKEVDIIYCEDTRITGLLLNHFDIKTPMRSYNLINENDLTSVIIDEILNGKNIAVVTDAGLPGISDPGYLAVKEATKCAIDVEVVPGVTAFATALVASSLPTRSFYFYGFLNSRQSKRIKELERMVDIVDTIILYEAPHRIKETLEDILTVLGNRNICLARELTKKYEEYLRGNVSEVLDVISELKGEMVIIIEGKKVDEEVLKLNSLDIKSHYDYYIKMGINPKEALKFVSKDRCVAKSIIYQEIFGKNKNK